MGMKLIHHFNNAEDGLEARIYKHPGGYIHVTLFDTDAQLTCSAVRKFNSMQKRQAFDYARNLSLGRAT